MSNEDWGIQVSIKHGPKDERGNPLFMTNIRGFTPKEIADHLDYLGEEADRIHGGINTFLARDTLAAVFPDAEPVKAPPARESRYGSREEGQGRSLRDRDGERCVPHGLPMKYKSGRSKAGNEYELLECTAERNPCDTIWPPKAR